MDEIHVLDLERLQHGIGLCPKEVTGAAYLAVLRALEIVGHRPTIACQIFDKEIPVFSVYLHWDDAHVGRRFLQNMRTIPELAAAGIAILIVEDFTEYTVVSEANSDSTGIDFYLGAKRTMGNRSFADFAEHDARLEVSGIIRENRGNSLRRRVNRKLEQSRKSDYLGTPAFVIVAEFSAPAINFTKRMPDNEPQREAQTQR